MAAVATAGAGNWSSTTNNLPWPGGTVPSATDTITIGHAVVIDQNVTAGSDPGFGGTAAIAISAAGALSFDTTASRTVTLLGDLTMASGGSLLIGATGAGRVPVANTITINFNNSGTIGRYGLRATYSTTSLFKCYGFERKTNTTLASQALSGQKVLVCVDATGWQDGDLISIASTAGGVSTTGQMEEIAITVGGVSGNTITLASNLTNTHAAGAHISNLTKNIVLTAASTKGWFADTRFGTLANHILDNVAVQYAAGPATAINTVNGYTVNGFTSGELSTGTFTDVVWYRPVNQNSLSLYGARGARSIAITNNCFASVTGTAIGLQLGQSPYLSTVTGCNFYRHSVGIQSSSSAGAMYNTVTNCYFVNCGSGFSILAATRLYIVSCTANGCTQAILHNTQGQDVDDTGSTYGAVIGNTQDINLTNILYTNIVFNLCTFASSSFLASQTNLILGSAITLLNCTQGATANLFKKYVANGVFIKNLTTQRSSVSSIELDTLTVGDCPYAFTFLAKNGVTYTLLANMQYGSTYDDAAFSYPTITISGLGITPVVATATSAALSAWEKHTLSVVQSSGADGLLTITFNGNSATATGKCYFDGIVAPPFITGARWYGYNFDETIPTRTVNANVVAAEATALAYTGIAINWTTKTLTITEAHTMVEIYDYCQTQMAAAANLTKAEFISTATSLNYIMLVDWDFIVDGVTVTATGQKVYCSGTGAWSVINAGDFTGILVDDTQTRVKINVTDIVAGSRIQVYDVDAVDELANEIVAGTTFSLAFTHTVDHDIRIRLTYVDGSATAWYWHTQTNTVTDAGLTFVAVQEENAIYEDVSVDGSTVTECSISGTTIRIYIDDPDNTTTIQRIYNWYQWYLFSEEGIREQDGTYVTAIDTTHYVFANTMKIINQDTVNPLNLTGANVTPVSGAATNIFDLSNGASICLNFNRTEGFPYAGPPHFVIDGEIII